MADVAQCRSCRAPVRWVLTDKGKRMPVDAEPVAEGNLTLDGDGVARYHSGQELAAVKALGLPLYVSHFVTCPQSSTWRK